MRLIVCDRCGVKGKVVPDTMNFGTKGEGFGSLQPDGGAPMVELCPACVKRALEKPEPEASGMPMSYTAEGLDEYEARRSMTPNPPGYVPERGETFTGDSAESRHQAP